MKKKSIALTISYLVFLISISILIYAIYSIYDSQHQVARTLEAWSQYSMAPIASNGLELPSTTNISSNPEAPLVPICSYPLLNEGDLIGKLIFDQFDQELPIVTGSSEKSLKKGVLHYYTSPLPGLAGNALLLGHRDGVFRFLKDVKVEDTFLIELPSCTLHYQIRSIDIIKAEDSSVFDALYESSITFVTCYPFHYFGPAPKRYIVRAELIDISN